MAKHRFQNNRSMQARRFVLIAALVLGLGVSWGRAGQQSSVSSSPSAKTGQGKPKSASAKPVGAATQRRTTTATPSIASLGAGKRDPFKLPQAGGGGEKGGPENPTESPLNSAALPGGERGLLISQLTLEGVVREQTDNKMIAVVTNETKRAYFLHENQSVYNGVVSKITPDAVYFKENVLDANGRATTREVVKRLGSAPGEER